MGEEKKTSVIDELKNMGGLPWWLYLICAGVVLAVAFTDTLGYDATAFIAVTMALAIILYKIGKILPIWNTYIGGGLLMVFFGTAVLKQLNLIPEKYVDLINNTVQGDVSILNVFIICLIMGSILSLDRKDTFKKLRWLYSIYFRRTCRCSIAWLWCWTDLWCKTNRHDYQICTSDYGRWQRSRCSTAFSDL